MAERGEYVFVFWLNWLTLSVFSQICKGFKEKFYDILLKVSTKTFSESSSVTGNDERRPKDGKFPTALIIFLQSIFEAIDKGDNIARIFFADFSKARI